MLINERYYGVLERVTSDDVCDEAVESIKTLGYAVVDGGYSIEQLRSFSEIFNSARQKAHDSVGGINFLREIDEHNTVRVPFFYERKLLEIALNPNVLNIVSRLIAKYHVLLQQNGVINPAESKEYNQGAWHRDLPYQHVVFSRPLAINALFCIDEFTEENGATMILPSTHKQESFPSSSFITNFSKQVTASAGSYIILDCMLYHTGATNRTSSERRALNHVYGAPILRQQIDLPRLLGDGFIADAAQRRLLGYDVETPTSVEKYLAGRRGKQKA